VPVRFLGDHNLARPAVVRLRDAGHDVVTTRQLGFGRASDAFLLLEAWRQWSVAWGINRRHADIIVLPQAQRWTAERTVAEIESVLDSVVDNDAAESFAGRLWRWRRLGAWAEVTGD